MSVETHTTYWWLILAVNIFSSGLLGLCVLRWRYLLLKPSVMFLAYFQLSVMWPGLTWYDKIVELVSDLPAYFIALHAFGLLATVVAVFTWHQSTRRLSRRIRSSKKSVDLLGSGPVIILGGVLALTVGWYLWSIGWRNTGLYSILTGAENTAQAREDSLKLITSSTLRYTWALTTSSVTYVLAYLLAIKFVLAIRRRNFFQGCLFAAGYTLVLLVVMLPGARAPAAIVVLTTLFSYYVRSGFRLSPATFCLLAALGLLVPSILSLLREHQEFSLSNLSIYYLDILDRVAGRSVEDNIWLVSYVQEHGFFGAAGIPILARISGDEAVNIFNLVGLYFSPNGIQSISANASFPAVNYACFGTVAIWLSLGLTFAMDGLLWLQSQLPRHLLIPSLGICAIISMNFAMTMFTTVFVTHGLMMTIATCYGLHFIGSLLGSRTGSGAATDTKPDTQ